MYLTTGTNFRPHTIVIYYVLNGKTGAGSQKYCIGQTTFNETSAVSGQYVFNTSPAGNMTNATAGIGDASSCGDGGTNANTHVFVSAVTNNSFTIDGQFSGGSTWTGASFSAYAIAYK